jgi:general secretion pathway protein G
MTRRAARGFTLLEIIVVVTIIALLATLIAPKLLGNIDKAKVAKAKAGVANIAQQVSIYMADNAGNGMSSRLPDDFELESLTQGESAVFKASDLIDPWGHPYMVVTPGEVNMNGFDIVSYGADGQVGGEGYDADITN